MAEQPATRKQGLFAAIICAAFGLYFTLVGFDLLPVPGGPKNLRAPLGVILFVGLALLLAGGLAFLHGIGRVDATGGLSPDAPQWVRVTHYLLGIATFACFGVIVSWIAFVPGPREFSGSFMGGTEAPVSDMTGRIAFGIGAIIIWICTIAIGISGARKLLCRTGP